MNKVYILVSFTTQYNVGIYDQGPGNDFYPGGVGINKKKFSK